MFEKKNVATQKKKKKKKNENPEIKNDYDENLVWTAHGRAV